MSEEPLGMITLKERPAHGMSMGCWYATEGGRKCPMCGKYAKPEDLGFIGGKGRGPGGYVVYLTAYGHLPGKGCNQ